MVDWDQVRYAIPVFLLLNALAIWAWADLKLRNRGQSYRVWSTELPIGSRRNEASPGFWRRSRKSMNFCIIQVAKPPGSKHSRVWGELSWGQNVLVAKRLGGEATRGRNIHKLFPYPYPTSVPGGTGKRRLRVSGHALVSARCPEHWTIGFERYRYWSIGYWPIFAGIGWYWYWPNTFFSNHTQYLADSSLRRHLATHDDLISRNSLCSRQLPHCKKRVHFMLGILKLNYVVRAGGFLWSPGTVAGLAGDMRLSRGTSLWSLRTAARDNHDV